MSALERLKADLAFYRAVSVVCRHEDVAELIATVEKQEAALRAETERGNALAVRVVELEAEVAECDANGRALADQFISAVSESAHMEVAALKLGEVVEDRQTTIDRMMATIDTLRAELADAQAHAAAAIRERDAARAFKAYVHKRLDDAGVPVDPNPMGTKKHGCRIEGRLDALLSAQPAEWPAHFERLAELHAQLAARDAEVTKLREALESLYFFPGVTDNLAPKGSLESIRDAVESALARVKGGNETKEGL